MTKKNAGIQKSEVIRIHKNDRLDLNFIKKEMGVSSKYKEGDVVHFLIDIYKGKKINESISGVQSVNDSNLQLKLDEYKGKHEYSKGAAKYWYNNFLAVCEKTNLNPLDERLPVPVKQ